MFKKFIKFRNYPKIEMKYHPNGKVKSKTTFVKGKENGVEIMRQENGQKKYERMWRAGKEHGMETMWYEDGQKKEEVLFASNMLLGGIEWVKEWNVAEVLSPNIIIKPIIKLTSELRNPSQSAIKK